MTSSGSFSYSLRSRSPCNAWGAGRTAAARTWDGCARCRWAGGGPGGWDEAQLPPARRGPRGGRCARRSAGTSPARSRCGWARSFGRRRLLVPAQPGPQRQPAALGQTTRSDHAAGARAGARWARRPQRLSYLTDGSRLVGLVPPRPSPRPDDLLAAAGCCSLSSASCSASAAALIRSSESPRPPPARRSPSPG